MTDNTNLSIVKLSAGGFAAAQANEIVQDADFQNSFKRTSTIISALSQKEAQEILNNSLKPVMIMGAAYNQALDIIESTESDYREVVAENQMLIKKLEMTNELVEKAKEFDPKALQERVRIVQELQYNKPIQGGDILKLDALKRFKTKSKSNKPIEANKNYMIYQQNNRSS